MVVVGLGQIGMGYDLYLAPEYVQSHARAFAQHPRFSLMAGVDPSASKRQAFELAYQCPAYADIDAGLHGHRPDLVAVAVPTRLHLETVSQLLSEVQPRMVLCEKPLAYNVPDARALVQICAARKVGLYVNYMRRSDPGALEILRRIVSGEIAGPLKGIAWYSKGFLHTGSHFVNLLESWLGPVQDGQVLDPGRLWDGVDPEPDVRVTFSRGTVMFLAAKEEMFSHYTVELIAPNGRLFYERGGEQITWQSAEPDPRLSGSTVLSGDPETVPSGMGRYQWNVVDQLAKAIDGKAANLCSGSEACVTLEAMDGILRKPAITNSSIGPDSTTGNAGGDNRKEARPGQGVP